MKTAKDIKDAVDRLNRVTFRSYKTERHMGQGNRLMRGNRKVSPILPAGPLVSWIEAFTAGFEEAQTIPDTVDK